MLLTPCIFQCCPRSQVNCIHKKTRDSTKCPGYIYPIYIVYMVCTGWKLIMNPWCCPHPLMSYSRWYSTRINVFFHYSVCFACRSHMLAYFEWMRRKTWVAMTLSSRHSMNGSFSYSGTFWSAQDLFFASFDSSGSWLQASANARALACKVKIRLLNLRPKA